MRMIFLEIVIMGILCFCSLARTNVELFCRGFGTFTEYFYRYLGLNIINIFIVLITCQVVLTVLKANNYDFKVFYLFLKSSLSEFRYYCSCSVNNIF